jgi:hypothetical protein
LNEILLATANPIWVSKAVQEIVPELVASRHSIDRRARDSIDITHLSEARIRRRADKGE